MPSGPRDPSQSGTLAQLAEIIGEDAMLRLATRFGGRRLYFPKDPTANRALVETVGLKAAQLLARRFGGVHFEIPLERGKRQRIVDLSQEKVPVRVIAERVGCTPRHVYAVRAEYKRNGGRLLDALDFVDPAQVDLFAPPAAPTSEDK